jgi:hypothetical protein
MTLQTASLILGNYGVQAIIGRGLDKEIDGT